MGRILARERAFFLADKREHGRQLCEQVFRKWPKLRIESSHSFDKIAIPDLNLRMKWETGRNWYGEVILRERTPEYYGYQHLVSGYQPVFHSLERLIASLDGYHSIASKNVPVIRAALAEEVRKGMTLAGTITDYLGDSYNLELLCSKTIERVVIGTPMLFFDAEYSAVPDHQGFWELKIGQEVLSRTRDKVDLARLRTSVRAILSNPPTTGMLSIGIAARYREVEKSLEQFKVGVSDVINAIQLGRTIQGSCDVCLDIANIQL